MFKPKGLTIYRRKDNGELAAHYKTRGRTGAKARAFFQGASGSQRRRMLEVWAQGFRYENWSI